MYRIGGSLRNSGASHCGDDFGIPLLNYWDSNLPPLSGGGTLSGGQFDWGGRLLKSNGGAQRLAQYGRKPCIECKRKSQPNCEDDGPSSNESWS